MRRIVVTISLLTVAVVLIAGGQPGTGAQQATPTAGGHPLVGS